MQSLPVCRQENRETVKEIFDNLRVREALDMIKKEQPKRVADQIALTEIPAPPFGEQERAKFFAQMLRDAGLTDVKQDALGNVIGRWKGTGEGPVLLIGAHLDTVFNDVTEIKVRKEGTKYYAPGISDDAAGLACVLQVARTLVASGIETIGDIVFVGTLGEEGNGDLRGCKALFAEETDFNGMLAIDSANVNTILKGSVGCKRYRVIFEGPGGHSLHKFGIAGSAIHGLARAITKVSDLDVPTDPQCTFNFGVIKGGTTINSIAERAESELDIRSYNQPALEAFIAKVMQALEEACMEENKRWNLQGDNQVQLIVEQIGDRPAGKNSDDASVIQAALGAQEMLGIELKKYEFAATDQNVPLFYGLPATTLGAGGTEANNHALTEWWDETDSYQGPQLALLTALALVGVKDVSMPLLDKRILPKADRRL